jgi:NADPH:quinone reductase-like Zn-dependent oxidoreductase
MSTRVSTACAAIPALPDTMMAARFHQYGGPEVVQLETQPLPQPAANDVLVRTLATTVSAADWRIRSLCVPRGFGWMMRLFFGFWRPRQPVLGTELVGEVAAVGAARQDFKPGDLVVGHAGARLGCHAEYRLFKANEALIIKPARLTVRQAAAMSFGGITALDFLINKGKLQAGERLLILGAAGSVGSAAVQLAHHQGARVTAVCRGCHGDTLQQLGAGQIIDYQQYNPLTGESLVPGSASLDMQPYDVILDTVGYPDTAAMIAALAPGGRALLVVADMPTTLTALWYRDGDGKRLIAGTASEDPALLTRLATWVEDGGYVPLVGEEFSIEQIQQAHQHLDDGHKHGNTVLWMDRALVQGKQDSNSHKSSAARPE